MSSGAPIMIWMQVPNGGVNITLIFGLEEYRQLSNRTVIFIQHIYFIEEVVDGFLQFSIVFWIM